MVARFGAIGSAKDVGWAVVVVVVCDGVSESLLTDCYAMRFALDDA